MIVAVGAFVGTNIDDLLIDTLLFTEAGSKKETRSVVVGKYIGVAALVTISILAAFGLRLIPQRFIRYLGLIPIGLGIKELAECFRTGQETEEEGERRSANLMCNTALITIANGADNLGVYIPLFVQLAPWQLVTLVCVFAAMTGVWCFLGKKLSELSLLQRILRRYKQFIVPVVYILLGIYVLIS